MIRGPGSVAALRPAEQFALHVLIDLARLIPVEDPAADVVRVDVTDRPDGNRDLSGWVAARWGIEPADGVVRVPRAALARLAEIAGAVREQRTSAAGRFGRVPSEENELVQAAREREPVVSLAAQALQRAAIAAAGRRQMRLAAPWPAGHRWAAALTHDLDVVAWWPLFTLLRLAELGGKGQGRRALQVAGAAVGAIGRDPVWHGVAGILEREAALSVRSTWFVLCGTPTLSTMARGDLTYRPESSRARHIVSTIGRGGHAIGLHGSFATMDADGLFGSQRARLERLAGAPALGVRQHFLRMRPGTTHRAMAAAGFLYDSSYGFADRNGFRLGVADVIPVWDDGTGAPLPLDAAPVTWMDRALSKYRNVEEPGAWVADGLALASACRAVEGLWVGVWHPNMVPPLGYPDAPEAFAALVEGLAAAGAYLSSLDELVSWRRRRRGVRVRAVAPDGRVELADPAGTAIALETPPE
ncbi:MAG: hypothetical protein AUH42_03615 [Gemmatimonadetes bacterium 13_1_40CM_70_11]|nr:MAG: hypothetical protein AUH42_03615 [Gemmatimonadetes bacterium 13_1_40CM_70_11]